MFAHWSNKIYQRSLILLRHIEYFTDNLIDYTDVINIFLVIEQEDRVE